MKKPCRVETLHWQQHTVTIKPDSLKFGEKIRCVSVSGEFLSFNKDSLVWISESESCTRICYNRLVSSSGTSGLILKSVKDGVATLYQSKSKTTLRVNTRFHKLIRLDT